jgi:hypothetical protein
MVTKQAFQVDGHGRDAVGRVVLGQDQGMRQHTGAALGPAIHLQLVLLFQGAAPECIAQRGWNGGSDGTVHRRAWKKEGRKSERMIQAQPWQNSEKLFFLPCTFLAYRFSFLCGGNWKTTLCMSSPSKRTLLPDLERLAQSYLHPVERWRLGLQPGFPCRINAWRTACREGLMTEFLLLLRLVPIKYNFGVVDVKDDIVVIEAVASGNLHILSLVLGLHPNLGEWELQPHVQKAVSLYCNNDTRDACQFVAGWQGDMIRAVEPDDVYQVATVVAGALSAGRGDMAKQVLASRIGNDENWEPVLAALCTPVATHADPFCTPWAQDYLGPYGGVSLAPPRHLDLEVRKALLHSIWPVHLAWLEGQTYSHPGRDVHKIKVMSAMVEKAVQAKDTALATWLLDWLRIEYIRPRVWDEAMKFNQWSLLDDLYTRDPGGLAELDRFFSIAVQHHSLGCLKWLCATFPTHAWQPHDLDGYPGRLTTWAHLVADTWTEGPMPTEVQATAEWLQEKGLLDPKVELAAVPRYPSSVCLHGRLDARVPCVPYHGTNLLSTAT